MKVLDRIKEYGTAEAIDLVVKLATAGAKKDPDKVLLRMIRLCKAFTKDPLWSAALDGMRERIKKNHPGVGVARKFLTQLSPRVRSHLVKTLIVKETLLGANYRHQIESKLGYYPPTVMVISPSMWCPLHCYGCYAGNYPQDQALTLEEVDRIIREAKDLGMHFIVFSGGEPFAWEPLFDIFERHRDVVFQVFTSGLLLDDGAVDRISELGTVYPAISCEGFEEETDKRRGKGAFKKVCRAMERLKKNGVLFTFSATVTRQNLDIVTSEEFVDFWERMGCLVGWYFMYMPIGRGPVLDLMPTAEQRVEMSRRIKHFRSRKPIFLIDFWNDGEHTRGCIAGGRKYFHINNLGDVEPCVFCHFATHNIKTSSLREALGSVFFREIRSRQPYDEDTRLPCILVDNNHVLREVVARTGARPTHPGAETLITDFAKALDLYGQDFRRAIRKAPVSTIRHTV